MCTVHYSNTANIIDITLLIWYFKTLGKHCVCAHTVPHRHRHIQRLSHTVTQRKLSAAHTLSLLIESDQWTPHAYPLTPPVAMWSLCFILMAKYGFMLLRICIYNIYIMWTDFQFQYDIGIGNLLTYSGNALFFALSKIYSIKASPYCIFLNLYSIYIYTSIIYLCNQMTEVL